MDESAETQPTSNVQATHVATPPNRYENEVNPPPSAPKPSGLEYKESEAPPAGTFQENSFVHGDTKFYKDNTYLPKPTGAKVISTKEPTKVLDTGFRPKFKDGPQQTKTRGTRVTTSYTDEWDAEGNLERTTTTITVEPDGKRKKEVSTQIIPAAEAQQYRNA